MILFLYLIIILIIILYNVVTVDITIEPYVNNLFNFCPNLYNKNINNILNYTRIKPKYSYYTPIIHIKQETTNPHPANVDEFY